MHPPILPRYQISSTPVSPKFNTPRFIPQARVRFDPLFDFNIATLQVQLWQVEDLGDNFINVRCAASTSAEKVRVQGLGFG